MIPLESALHFHQLGVSVVPLKPMSKKQPLIKWTRYKRYQPPLWRLVQWFASGQNNIALVCGTARLVILDFDSFDSYNQWLSSHTAYTDTRMVRTARGLHVYYFVNKIPARNYCWNNIEIKCNGLCMSAPSIHPSGYKYKIVNNIEIMTVDSVHQITGPSNGKNLTVVGGRKNQPASTEFFQLTRSLVSMDCIRIIKNHISITDFFPDYKPSGGPYAIAHCPMHDDNESSLSLDLENNRANCFKPGCPLNGPHGHDVIDCYQILYDVSLKVALSRLMELLGE